MGAVSLGSEVGNALATQETTHTVNTFHFNSNSSVTQENFNQFWEKLWEPVLRKVLKCFEQGMAPPEYDSCPKDMYKRIYFEALDLSVTSHLTNQVIVHTANWKEPFFKESNSDKMKAVIYLKN